MNSRRATIPCPLPHPHTPARLQGGSSTADGDEFLSLTQQLALSSAFGAVQCSFGPCSSVQHVGSGGEGAAAAAAGGAQLAPEQQQQPDMMLLVRFQESEQLQSFLDCPPVAALLQVGQEWAVVCTTAASLLVAPAQLDPALARGCFVAASVCTKWCFFCLFANSAQSLRSHGCFVAINVCAPISLLASAVPHAADTWV